ncbi:uracil-DNA glycosylase [Patescibacteria group bacterium]|nr:uracil-DNA glycosylase [Patescibacteria group bacterium]
MSDHKLVLNSLKKLQLELEACIEDLPLAKRAEDIVHGEGQVPAKIMMIGEAPGYNEVVQRRPFVGRSGQLLRQTIKDVNLPIDEVFISNIVKARPPDNRDPSPEEILAYKPFLDREIELVNPILMVTLGRYSMAKFLPDVFISQVHGRLHRVKWNDRWLYVLPMYHPAAGLRSTQVKESFINDFKKIQKIMEWVEHRKEIDVMKEEVAGALF